MTYMYEDMLLSTMVACHILEFQICSLQGSYIDFLQQGFSVGTDHSILQSILGSPASAEAWQATLHGNCHWSRARRSQVMDKTHCNSFKVGELEGWHITHVGIHAGVRTPEVDLAGSHVRGDAHADTQMHAVMGIH
jgi:hypothetical protein